MGPGGILATTSDPFGGEPLSAGFARRYARAVAASSDIGGSCWVSPAAKGIPVSFEPSIANGDPARRGR